MFLTAEPSPQPMDFPILKVFLLVLVLISGLYKSLGSFYINSLLRIHFANIFSLPELPFIRLVVSLAAQSICFDAVLFVHPCFSCLGFW